MKVLMVNYEFPPIGGGGGVVTALLAEELAKGHEVTILTSQGPGLPPERFENGARVVRVPVFFRNQQSTANIPSMLAFILIGIRAGRQILKAEKYDVINTHFALPSGPVGDALARFGGIPNVLSLHGGDLYDPSKFTSPHRHPLLRAWVRRLIRRADVVVGDSTNIFANMRKYYAPDIEGVRIPLGIKRPEVAAVSRSRYGFAQDEVLLVTVGRLVPRKAVAQLISMMENMRTEKVRLLIVGSGPQHELLKDEAIRKHVGDQVVFMGQVDEDEKFGILQLSDIFVSTSQHEGFGLVFLEAMACGLPVVCYSHGGQTDFLEDTMTGYLLPLNDLQGFEDRCRTLIKKRDMRLKMGRENLQRVEGLFIDHCAQRYAAVFEEAIALYSQGPLRKVGFHHESLLPGD